MAEFLSLGVLVNQVTAPAQRGILHNVRRRRRPYRSPGYFMPTLPISYFHTVGQEKEEEDEGAPSGEKKKERAPL